MHGLLGFSHTVFGLIALVSGLVVFLARKGTRNHRAIGYVYVASMLALNGGAFLIYRLFGRFGPFHVAAVISLATLAAGFVPLLLRRPAGRWLSYHYGFMCWSYVGLLAATVAEVADRVPGLRPEPAGVFCALVIGSTLVVMVGGAALINRLEARVVRSAAGPQRAP